MLLLSNYYRGERIEPKKNIFVVWGLNFSLVEVLIILD